MCNEFFSCPVQKVEHNMAHHIVCARCPWKCFYDMEALLDHWQRSSAHAKTFCTQCRVDFWSSRDLKQHTAEYDPDWNDESDNRSGDFSFGTSNFRGERALDYSGMYRGSCQRSLQLGYESSYGDRTRRTAATESNSGSNRAPVGSCTPQAYSDRTYESSDRDHGTHRRHATGGGASRSSPHDQGPRGESSLRSHLSDSRRPPPPGPPPTSQNTRNPGTSSRRHPSDSTYNVPGTHPNPYPRPRLLTGMTETHSRHPSSHGNSHRHTTVRPKPSTCEESLDIYALFDLSPLASQAEIARAVRKKRAEVHPDRLRRAGMSREDMERIDRRARIVGGAADVLMDVEMRRKYDERRAMEHDARMRMRTRTRKD